MTYINFWIISSNFKNSVFFFENIILNYNSVFNYFLSYGTNHFLDVYSNYIEFEHERAIFKFLSFYDNNVSANVLPGTDIENWKSFFNFFIYQAWPEGFSFSFFLTYLIRKQENNFFSIENYYFLLNYLTLSEKGIKYLYFFHYVLSSLFLIIGVLIAVAFFTLFERKVMASMQRRKGPDNRISGRWGILQPLADGLKLLAKEIITPKRATKFLFLIAPLYTFLMSLLGWCVIPWSSEIIFADPKLSALYSFAVSSLGVYGILLSGWASNSKYAFLGGLRSAAQMISYEVTLGFIVIIVALISGTYNFREIVYKQEVLWFCFPLLPLSIIFFVSMLAETNRAPFDLPEAEAELVSGYNTEYSSMIFAMFFLGEYSSMLLMASIYVIFFFGGWLSPFGNFFEIYEGFWFFFKVVCVAFAYIWVRATLPRYRYNQLMSIGWKIFLPLTFGLLLFYLGLLLFFDGLPLDNKFETLQLESFLNIRKSLPLFLEFKNVYLKP